MVYFYNVLVCIARSLSKPVISDVFLIRELLHSGNIEMWIDVFRGSINTDLQTGLL